MGSDENEEQPNVWLPEGVLPGFRQFMDRFYWECFEVGKNILRAIALGIGLGDEEYLVKYHSGHGNQLRLLHYPSIPAAWLEGGKYARIPPHTDWSTITLLFQDECGGLEAEDIKHKGLYMPATPIENALVMNVGDLLQRWSNGKLHIYLFPVPTSDPLHPIQLLAYILTPQTTSVQHSIESISLRFRTALKGPTAWSGSGIPFPISSPQIRIR